MSQIQKQRIRIRPFHPNELKAVQDLVLESTTTGEESITRGALYALLVHPFAWTCYAGLLADGVLLGPKNAPAALALAVSIVLAFGCQYMCMAKHIVSNVEHAFRTDLGDVVRCYQSGTKEGGWAGEFWVADVEEDGVWALAGCAGLEHLGTNSEGHLRRTYVLPKHRKKGIAKRLMNVVLEHAKFHGLTSLYLGTTVAPSAIAFYEKCGWKKLDVEAAPGEPLYLGAGFVKLPILFYNIEL